MLKRFVSGLPGMSGSKIFNKLKLRRCSFDSNTWNREPPVGPRRKLVLLFFFDTDCDCTLAVNEFPPAKNQFPALFGFIEDIGESRNIKWATRNIFSTCNMMTLFIRHWSIPPNNNFRGTVIFKTFSNHQGANCLLSNCVRIKMDKKLGFPSHQIFQYLCHWPYFQTLGCFILDGILMHFQWENAGTFNGHFPITIENCYMKLVL